MEKTNKKYISVTELADILKISRVAVFKKIKNKQIPAEKIGKTYVIPFEVAEELTGKISRDLTPERKEEIDQAVQKVVDEYGETLKLLAKE